MRLQQSRNVLFADTTAQKRPAEPTDGFDEVKRQKVMGATQSYPPLPPPPNTVAQLFTLTEDPNVKQFDVTLLPADSVSDVTAVLLQYVDSSALDLAIHAIRSRYTHLQKVQQPTPIPEYPMAGPTGIDDEDDYDPEFVSGGDGIVEPTTEIALDSLAQPALDLGPFELPKPPPLTSDQVAVVSDQSVEHLYQIVASLDNAGQISAKQKLGLNRLAASTNDRDSWMTILVRLATRAPVGLEDFVDSLVDGSDLTKMAKPEDEKPHGTRPADRIRQMIFMYIMDDFRPRLNLAISWLTEEWYADKMAAKTHAELSHLPNYSYWVQQVIERLLPYLDAKDKNLLIRFVSEIPAIDRDLLDRIKTLARDPERVNMCILSMQYLLMLRPPTRGVVLDTMESMWNEGDDQAKKATAKVLGKWRPGFLERTGEVKDEGGSGVKLEAAKEVTQAA